MYFGSPCIDHTPAEPDDAAARIADRKHQPVAEPIVKTDALAATLQDQAHLKQAGAFLFRCPEALEQRIPGIGGVAQTESSAGVGIDAASLNITLRTRIILEVLLEASARPAA